MLYKLPEEVKHFAVLTVLRSIIFTAINIFLPAYLIYAYSLRTAIIYMSMQYFLVYMIFSVFLFKRLSKKHSAEYIQIISTIFGVVGIVVLFLVRGLIGIFVSAFLLNINTTLYWLSKHYVVVGYAKQREMMEESVFIDVIGRIAQFLLPLVSSYIIYSLGYPFYYAVITFLMLFLVIYMINKIRRKKTYLHVPHKISMRFTTLFLLEGVVATGWLLITTALLFYNLNSNVKFYGIIKALSQIIIIAASFYIAKVIDKKHNLKISLFSLVLLSFIYLLYFPLRGNPYLLSIIVVMISLFYNLGSISPTAFLYEYAKNIEAGIIIWRESLLYTIRSIILFISMYFHEVVYLIAFGTILYVVLFYEIAIKHKHLKI